MSEKRPLIRSSSSAETIDDRVQLHIGIERCQHKQLKAAVKRLGYSTVSEYVREQVRRVIVEANAHSQNDPEVSKKPFSREDRHVN